MYVDKLIDDAIALRHRVRHPAGRSYCSVLAVLPYVSLPFPRTQLLRSHVMLTRVEDDWRCGSPARQCTVHAPYFEVSLLEAQRWRGCLCAVAPSYACVRASVFDRVHGCRWLVYVVVAAMLCVVLRRYQYFSDVAIIAGCWST